MMFYRNRDSLCQFSFPLSSFEVSRTALFVLSGVIFIFPQPKRFSSGSSQNRFTGCMAVRERDWHAPLHGLWWSPSRAGVMVLNRSVSNPRRCKKGPMWRTTKRRWPSPLSFECQTWRTEPAVVALDHHRHRKGERVVKVWFLSRFSVWSH